MLVSAKERKSGREEVGDIMSVGGEGGRYYLSCFLEETNAHVEKH